MFLSVLLGDIVKPEDLRGKKIATAGYSSTSLTWVRDIFEDEYGLKPTDMQWVISKKDSSAKDAGKISKQESILPKGVPITYGPEGKDESDLLETGVVGAFFHEDQYKQSDQIISRYNTLPSACLSVLYEKRTV